jgi:single-stranded DNA-binding protein
VEYNLVTLAGRLAIDPEERTFESGAHLVRYLVTVRSDTPRRRVDVIPVTLWDPSPDHVGPKLSRGDRVMIVGMVQRRFWQAPDGRRSRVEVIAHHVEAAPGDGAHAEGESDARAAPDSVAAPAG